MNFPNVSNGHLYQYVMTLGAFIMIVSCYSLAIVAESHDAKVQMGVVHLLNKQEDEDSRKFWQAYLEGRKKDAEYVVLFLFGTAIAGAITTVVGGGCWYGFVQRFEDKKRWLENQQLNHEVDEKKGRKRIQLQ